MERVLWTRSMLVFYVQTSSPKPTGTTWSSQEHEASNEIHQSNVGVLP
jgi:hypothetical protein